MNTSNRSQEFPFLRTRRKAVAAIVEQKQARPPSRREMFLERATRPVRHAPNADLPKLNTPVFHGNTEMSLHNPVVRLDYRQSAIGSMVIRNAEAFSWEMDDLLSGLQVNSGQGSTAIEPRSFKNRKIAEFVDSEIIINLRHGKSLRRFIAASTKDDLFIELYDGSEIFIPMERGKNAMLMYRVGNEFEIRLEHIESTDLLNVFGIIPSQISR